MTTRLAFEIQHLPPEELKATAHIPQCPRATLTAVDILPSEADEQLFTTRRKLIVKRFLVTAFHHCKFLAKSVPKMYHLFLHQNLMFNPWPC